MTTPIWTDSARAAYSRDLAERGLPDISRCSDALEVLGLPRLSDSTPAQRRETPEVLLSPSGQEAVSYVLQSRRAVQDALRAAGRAVVRQAREELGLQAACNVPSKLRLRELLDLYARVLVLVDEAETAREAA